MDQVRVSDSARYPDGTSFTPPDPFTVDANTKLLVQSNFSEGGIGADHSLNYNYFTPSNMGAEDMVEDNPKNNFCTFNPVGRIGSYSSSTPDNTNLTFTQGNLLGSGSGGASSACTFPITSGKWYWEISTTGSGNANVGIYGSGNQRNSDTNTVTAGNIYGIKFDADTGTGYQISSDGISYSSSGLNSVVAPWTPWFQSYSTNCHFNFGQDSSFAGTKTAQGNQDDNKKGDFYYDVPAGYLALCTDNLTATSIAKPEEHRETVLYAGNGAARDITTSIQPDLVWLKNRSDGYNHILQDVVRTFATTTKLSSNASWDSSDGNLSSNYGYISAADSDSFSLATTSGWGQVNESGNNFVSWIWKGDGTSGSSNTDGTITSTVNVNSTAGFSIVKYTGNGSSSQTIGHGLSKAPGLIISKGIDGAYNWRVFGENIGLASANFSVRLDLTNEENDNSNVFGTYPGASTWTVGNDAGVNENGTNYIAYCFLDIEGYCKVGTFFGNNNVDGPYVWTGFQPSFIIAKCVESVSGWDIVDNVRDPYNSVTQRLYPNSSDAEETASPGVVDFVGSGFKVRTTSGNWSTHGSKHMYLAFAKTPFKTSNAR